ncbi:IucA/IucC family protein [Halobacillus aidingensis]|uniref:Siderophore synthetase component n=1 Tax=Halobacillus aidingensis TaxID=240303 RepID=A0A1H0FJS8_HALAD|nr:IucA/IucC family protein [Halobacillus aidingensis]SDN95028.1 Siderophore synthetase component [Halobacillus aidingensis]
MEAMNLIKKKLPGYESTFLENVKKADTLTLHQLIQAIFRERVVPYEWRNRKNTLVLLVNDGELHVPVSNLYIFQHIDIDGDIRFVDQEGNQSLVDKSETCLELLFPGNNRSDFYKEILNSVTNLALALTVAEHRRRQIGNLAEDAFSYAASQKSPLTFFEQWVIQGHTIHPCSRTRMGLTPEDVARYAPEWQGKPGVLPLLVHKDRYHMTSKNGESMKSILLQEYPQFEKAFQHVCKTHDVVEEDYEIIPIHPWQWEHTITKYYKDDLEEKLLIPVNEFTIPTSALISFRSLAPLDDRTKHHIKTAVNVQMTSAVRTVSAASTKNGPTLSRLLQTIFCRDEDLSRSLSIMGEEVGIHYKPYQEESQNFLQKNAAAILRENPEKDLGGDEVALPAASLLAPSPFSGKLVVEEVAAAYPSPEAFIYDYAKTVLPGVLTLITKYGISMEAHLQNCVVIFEKGKPKKAVLRDYGGIRIMNERLEQYFDQQPIDPSTNLLTKDRSELLDVFSHALFHNHLGEIIVALARRKAVSEKVMWSKVEQVIHETYEHMKEDKQILTEALLDKEEILTKPTKMKALVNMRLSDQYTENLYVEIPHPFAERKEVKQNDPALN